ncbi:MAG: restriction endonuclease [Candidatus Pacebacteria bacterium]|nr:restriction endonuclease [Candidatus Paceibacterota bacterium]
MNIINSLGEIEKFSSEKVYRSILRTGASKEIAKKVTSIVVKKIRPNISTFEIYRIAKKYLAKEKEASSLKFDLKYAIKRLGPEGFIFEKFIKEILQRLGYEVTNNRIIQGKCISYEIDFLIKTKESKHLGECKYRNGTGDRIDVNVLLKSFAVLDDIKSNNINCNIKTMVVTNEKFTEKAIRYAKCKNIKILGWNYPEKEGLETIISANNLYPITILPSFNKNYLQLFAEQNVLLVSNLTEEKIKTLEKLKISRRYLNKLKEEIGLIIN